MKEVLIIDDSNVYIGMRKQEYPFHKERFDYPKFARQHLKDEKSAEKIIVGSRKFEGEGDRFWNMLRNKGFKTKIFERAYGEKEVDTEIIALGLDAIRDKEPGRFILMSGDKDMGPLIGRAHDAGWKTEIWTWENGINSGYAFNEIIYKVNYIDDYADELVFHEPTEEEPFKEYLGEYKKRTSSKKEDQTSDSHKSQSTDEKSNDGTAEAIGGGVAAGIGVAALGVAAVALAPVEVPLIAAAAVLGGAGALIGGVAGFFTKKGNNNK
jgi:uncharacterized LabA/DUF88 family protein